MSVAEGVRLLFTNSFIRAEELFSNPSEDSDKPRMALLHAQTSFIRAAATFGDALLDDALAKIWAAEAVGKAARNVSGQIIQADAHLLGSMVQFIQGSYVKAGWNLRKSWKFYESAKKALESYEGEDREELVCGCQFGVGFFNLFISMLPSTVMRIAEFVGFSGDRQYALEQLRAAVTSDRSMSPFSAMMLLSYLCGIAGFTGEQNEEYLQEGERLLEWADQRFPRSIFFAWMRIRYLRTRGRLDEAIQQCRIAVEECRDLPVLNILTYYHHGWCAFVAGYFQEGAEAFGQLLNDESSGAKTSAQVAYAYHAGVCYSAAAAVRRYNLGIPSRLAAEQKGDDEKKDEAAPAELSVEALEELARRMYTDTPNYLNPKRNQRDIENYSVRRARQRLEGVGNAVLDALELNYIFSCYEQMQAPTLENCQQLLNIVQQNESARWTNEEIAKAHLIQGCIYRGQLKYDEAIQSFQACIALESSLSRASRVKCDGTFPYCHYFMGQTLFAQGRINEAEVSYNAAYKANSGCDLGRPLGFRLHAFKQSIANARK
eukprot:TRINITY_DN1843_c0_g1_i1.p1 TRINITY_DN1843_c0_g1~~TRINITY_DN1843_c0_g1_i1.p1  ORF type:complete len:566 (+),score=205.73 TRINITY_DN1843_c0_g1_i1:62-1699(+)